MLHHTVLVPMHETVGSPLIRSPTFSMKHLILITADLHDRRAQFEWLGREAPNYGLTIIAGDLMDAFSQSTPMAQQRRFLAGWLASTLETGAPIAVVDGNHDEFHPEPGDDTFPPTGSGLITPGQHRVVEGISLVSCLPWNAQDWPNAAQWRDLVQLRERCGLPWTVICHLPPTLSQLGFGSFDDARHVDQLVLEQRPDYLVCGHIHEGPYLVKAACERVRATLVINPGCATGDYSVPNHVILNPATGSCAWECNA